MTTRTRQLALVSLLCIPVLSRGLLLANSPTGDAGAYQAIFAGGPVGPTTPILLDTNGDGRPSAGDAPVTLKRVGNDISVQSPLDCNPHDQDNVFALQNPTPGGQFQRISRVTDAGVRQQVDIQSFLRSRPNSWSYTETDRDGVARGSGSLVLQDRDDDRIQETVFAHGTTAHAGQVGVSLSLVALDTTGDFNPDYVSVPWSQSAAFGVEPNDGCQAGGPGGSDPQVWVPLADTDGDGRPDSVAFDLDGNGVLDPDLFAGAALGAGPPNLPVLRIPPVLHVSEGTPTLAVSVTLSPASLKTVSVDYTTVPLTAAAPADYTQTTGSVTFIPGETSKTFLVPIVDDLLFEGAETFTIELSLPIDAVFTEGTSIVTIDDNDPGAPSFSVGDATLTEGNAGTQIAQFPVSLNAPAPVVTTVQFATANGSATAGSDYVAASGTVTFNPGDVQKLVDVTINGDVVWEASETFTVTLSNPSAGAITDPTGVGSIVNDDPSGLSITDVSIAEGHAGVTNAVFTVTLSPPTANPVTVQYATANGTATAGVDYATTAGALTFSAQETAKTIAVPIVGDTLFEPNETFVVTLSAATNANLIKPQGVGTITNDDLPAITITDVSVAEGNVGSSPATFTVSLSGASGTAVTVQYATADGTAIAAQDYAAASGTVTFNAGETSKPVQVTITGDQLVEPSETFTVNLSAAVNATIADNQGLGTITNDDAAKVYPLAEGATGSFFDTNILIANPNAVAVQATVKFVTPTGVAVDLAADDPKPGLVVTQNLTLAALSRTTIAVDSIAGLENTAFSTAVTSAGGLPLVVERTMYWNSTRYGGASDLAATEPRTTWYFAEGASSSFFDSYLLLANYGAQPSTATVTYLRENEPPVGRTVSIPADTRVTLQLGTIPELAGRAFSIVVNADQPIGAERAMYFGAARLFDGGHASAGKPDLSTTWFHAEGATGPFFDTFILVGNPNGVPATVTFTFLRPSGAPIVRQRIVPPNTRLTINVEGVDPLLADTAVSTMITSTQPVVSERSQYWPGPYTTWYEGHTSFGVPSLGTQWGLAEGEVGGPLGHETYILLTNPGAAAADVEVQYLRVSGPPVVKTYSVPANTRLNVHVNSRVPELSNETFGALVRSTNGVPIAVDRSSYWSVGGQTWAGGTSVSAARLQ